MTVFPESLEAGLRPILAGLLAFTLVVVMTRLIGRRTFSKMSSVDFAGTLAIGSLLAAMTLNGSVPLLTGMLAIVTIFGVQGLQSVLRMRSRGFRESVDNGPLLLMDGPRMLRENMARAQVSEQDVLGKLREANVLDFDQVRAVVFETTGDVTVLHGPADGPPLNPDLLRGVRRSP